jgi:hypothetical protein
MTVMICSIEVFNSALHVLQKYEITLKKAQQLSQRCKIVKKKAFLEFLALIV